MAAGIIKTMGAVVQADFVPNSVEFWAADAKGSEGDYHGNFDAVQFERWFKNLCETLKQYGECYIHMDGASYHKRNLKPAPNSGWKKAQIQHWLQENGRQHYLFDLFRT